MKASGPMGRRVALAAGVAALFVGCGVLVEGHRTAEQGHRYKGFQALSEGTDGGSNIQVCGAAKQGPGAAEEKLDLTAELGRPLQFRCGASRKLNPPETDSESPAKVLSFYAYTKESGCNTTTPKVLKDELAGATLVVASKNRNGSETTAEPVYTFQYTSAPPQETFLCYTCNITAPGSTEEEDADGQNRTTPVRAAPGNCTVHITVPKTSSTVTTPSTEPPNSTSGAHTMTAFIAAAAGGFLSTLLRT